VQEPVLVEFFGIKIFLDIRMPGFSQEWLEIHDPFFAAIEDQM